MTISATGPSGRNSVSARFHPPEMMLVLLLIGVSASMVLLAFPSARTRGGHTDPRRAFRRNWILSASAGSKPVSSSALSSTLSAGSLCACSLPTIAPRRRLTTGGATRSGCRCRPDASPRRKPSRGPGADAALSRRPRRGRRASSPTCLFFPAVKSRRFSCGLTPRWASTSTPEGDSQPLAAREQP